MEDKCFSAHELMEANGGILLYISAIGDPLQYRFIGRYTTLEDVHAEIVSRKKIFPNAEYIATFADGRPAIALSTSPSLPIKAQQKETRVNSAPKVSATEVTHLRLSNNLVVVFSRFLYDHGRSFGLEYQFAHQGAEYRLPYDFFQSKSNPIAVLEDLVNLLKNLRDEDGVELFNNSTQGLKLEGD